MSARLEDSFLASVIDDKRLYLERPRIDALLEKALESPVLLVSAGEGYGKTHAVFSFLRRLGAKGSGNELIRISLSERDNDPSHFWESVVMAVGHRDPRAKKALEDIGFPESRNQINRCFSILSKAGAGGKKHIIAADDCHLIREGPIQKFIMQLFTFPLPNERFILISRTESIFNLMPLLSKGLLSRITAEDLRFSKEEISGYFRLRDIPLPEKECDEILADTEGWALAISLLTEEMKSGNKNYHRSLLESGNFRAMEDEMFASMPAPLQRFLIIISIFEEWPVEVLRRVAASMPEKLPAAEELAKHLNRLSSFLRYDAYINGFRIHRLFLDYLREKQKSLSHKEKTTACSIKALWCMENNLRINAATY